MGVDVRVGQGRVGQGWTGLDRVGQSRSAVRESQEIVVLEGSYLEV